MGAPLASEMMLNASFNPGGMADALRQIANSFGAPKARR